jgi:hypothetical protein
MPAFPESASGAGVLLSPVGQQLLEEGVDVDLAVPEVSCESENTVSHEDPGDFVHATRTASRRDERSSSWRVPEASQARRLVPAPMRSAEELEELQGFRRRPCLTVPDWRRRHDG